MVVGVDVEEAVCDIEQVAMAEGWDTVLPEYRAACISKPEYRAWSPECCTDHCPGHLLCGPCARISRETGNIAVINSLPASA
jgi:hypothetical protein